MSIENLFNHRCSIYHIVKTTTSPGFGLPGQTTYSYPKTPDLEHVPSYSGNVTVSTATAVDGFATGTTNAGEVFIAGEEGPELIVGKAGSTVFPADETDRIINAVTNNDNRVTSYALSNPDTNAGNEGGGSGEQSKHIVLEIGGGSPIEVSGGSGASKEEVVEILLANLRPALLNIVKDEIFEEGDGSYEH